MKQFIVLLMALLAVLALSSCEEGTAEIEEKLIVAQVESNKKDDQCESCLISKYKYRIKLKTNSGTAYYFTDYKHEVGDTLVSLFEFTDNREGEVKNSIATADSLRVKNKGLEKKNKELTLYNELLMGIIQDNATK